jgi:fatty acid-binding protein DegV
MRRAVFTDASCDLPEQFLRYHGVEILPNTMQIEQRLVLDERDAIVSARLYRQSLNAGGGNIAVQPQTSEQIRQRIADRLMPRYDYLLCLTPDARVNVMHRNLTRAAFGAMDETASLRREQAAGLGFGLRIVDTGAISAGLGLMVAAACIWLERGAAPGDIVSRLERLRQQVASFLVPGDGARIIGPRRKRDRLAQGLGWRPILQRQAGRYAAVRHRRGGAAAIQYLLSRIGAEIRRGGAAGLVVLSYGGDPAYISQLPGFPELSSAAQEHKVTLLPAMMSISRAAEIGAGCLEVAYASGSDIV